MKLTVELSFENRNYKAGDYYDDFCDAIKFASYHLYARHGVSLSDPGITNGNHVAVIIDIPDHMYETFSIGNHLRGISAYLLKSTSNKDLYRKMLVGRRLLSYYVIDDSIVTKPVSEEIKLLRDISEKLERIESMLNEMKGEHNGL